jgi:hypothetical protein
MTHRPRAGFGARKGHLFGFITFGIGGFLYLCPIVLGILGIASVIYGSR